ncbi:MAG TPA: kelch repeat-containing protein [Nitrososphaera sp.]|nr:kelch repeat-containing protein [Nitrososphaera sp.]
MAARRTIAVIAGIAAAIALAAVAFTQNVIQTGTSTLPEPISSPSAWSEGKPMPTPRTEVAGAAVGGKIYIIGGFDQRGRAVSTVEVYDPQADQWNASEPLPWPLHHAAAASYNGTLYVVGGYLADNEPTDKLLAYDPQADSWQELAPMPTARGALAANFVNGTLYAVSGVNSSFGFPAFPLATNEAYDPETNGWAQKAPMPTPRQHLASAVLYDRLYVIGGRIDGLSSNLDSNEMYDALQDNWTKLAPMPSKRGGLAAASSDADGNIYVFGGESPAGTFSNNESYHPVTDRWVSATPMPDARHGLAAVTVDNEIYVIGGGPRPGLTVSGSNQIYPTYYPRL